MSLVAVIGAFCVGAWVVGSGLLLFAIAASSPQWRDRAMTGWRWTRAIGFLALAMAVAVAAIDIGNILALFAIPPFLGFLALAYLMLKAEIKQGRR
jgi:hypothetical protein